MEMFFKTLSLLKLLKFNPVLVNYHVSHLSRCPVSSSALEQGIECQVDSKNSTPFRVLVDMGKADLYCNKVTISVLNVCLFNLCKGIKVYAAANFTELSTYSRFIFYRHEPKGHNLNQHGCFKNNMGALRN